MVPQVHAYPAQLDIDYEPTLNRWSTLLRLIWAVPILVILSLPTATETVVTEAGEQIRRSGGGIAGGLWAATALMLLVRMRYPKWWFDFARELTRVGHTWLCLPTRTRRRSSNRGSTLRSTTPMPTGSP